MQETPLHYELGLIISGALAETEQPEVLKGIKKILVEAGATITKETDLGRKKLAYAIKHMRHGFYFAYEFDLLPKQVKPLENELKLNANILRYLTVKKKVKTAADFAQEEKIKASKIRHEQEKQAVVEEEKKAIKASAKPKVSLEDLDKKLDELLDENII